MAKRNRKIKKSLVQRIASRVGNWLVAREDRIREVRLNREATRMNRKLDWAAEVARRAHEQRNYHKVQV